MANSTQVPFERREPKMAGDEIIVNAETVTEVSAAFEDFAEGYHSFRMQELSGAAPVPGSSDHDGLGASVGKALDAWSALMISDANDIQYAGFAFDSLDKKIAHGLLGLEWSREE